MVDIVTVLSTPCIRPCILVKVRFSRWARTSAAGFVIRVVLLLRLSTQANYRADRVAIVHLRFGNSGVSARGRVDVDSKRAPT